MARPLVIAHRGASAEAPENTLAAFRRALALGADAIELDVRLTRDGVPVVFHDATLNRLTAGRGPVARRTRRELRAFSVRGEPIPTLGETLDLLRGRAVAHVELKRGVRVAPVVRAVRRARAAGGVIFGSFAPALLREARRLAPEIPALLITAGPRRPLPPAQAAQVLIRRAAALGFRGVSLHWRAVRSRAFVRAFRRHATVLWCWTVNDPRTMRRLASWGVDGILSDDPARLKSTLARAGNSARSRLN